MMPRLQSDTRKQRDLVFACQPSDQAVQAARFLARIDGVIAHAFPADHRVSVAYDISEHSLLELETRLNEAGFHLDGHLLQKILRALAHYSEEVQRDNLQIPAAPLKSRDIYVKVWEKHQHGDHDDTPEELRRYL